MNKNKDKLDEGKILAKLKNQYDECRRYYQKIHKKMRLLNSTYNGDLWRAVGAKFPPYQLLPDTNYVSFVTSNILASIYTVAKSAQIVPTAEQDVEICEILTTAIEHDWDKNDVGYYQYQAGERAALMNVGYTQVYWNEYDGVNGNVNYKNIDPIKFMRDPFAASLEESGYCMVYNTYHKSELMRLPQYREAFKEKVLDKHIPASSEAPPSYREENHVGDSQDHYTVFVHWVKDREGKINEYHTLDHDVLLLYKLDIKPSMFPFAELYCNMPGSSLVGTSEPAKIFANNLVYNLLDSIAATAEYKNQRPPKFVSSQSALNLAAFKKHGNEADMTFIVNGDASKAVHYHEFPQVSPQLAVMQQSREYNVKNISGVDDKYTGRDTGSIITTGGTEEMLNRVTLIDTPKVMNYEHYTRKLTELTLRNMLEFGPKRVYLLKDDDKSTLSKTAYKTVEIDFPQIPSDAVFEYVVDISSELPKNKQRIQAWANNMMEKQMQYQQAGLQVDVITPQEWIRCQDVPHREQMLKRMEVQSGLNAYVEAQNVIAEYAAMLERGDLPEDAMAMAADGLQAMKQGEMTPYQSQMEQQQPPVGGGNMSMLGGDLGGM